MAFVLVVAGANRGVHGTQFEREPRIALEIHASRIPIERYESEHSAGYLEHGDTISEGIVLDRSGKTSAQFEDLLSRHVRVLFVSLASACRCSSAPSCDADDGKHVDNAGYVWDPATGPGERYTKRHLVPFGEYIPLRSLLGDRISRLGRIAQDFVPGKTPGVLELGPATIADVICFEVGYDGIVRDAVRGGGEVDRRPDQQRHLRAHAASRSSRP